MIFIAVLVVLLVWERPGLAHVAATAQDHSPQTLMSRENQELTVQALKEISRGQWSRAEQRITASGDLRARGLYDWLYIIKNGRNVSFEQAAAFIRAHPDWPRQGTLQLAAEQAMNESLSAAQIVDWFDNYPPRTPEGMERYLGALEALKNYDRLKDVLRPWWRTALLQPAQQQRFLARFGRYIDEQAHAARFDNMIYRSHYTNARAVARILSRGYPALAEARIALAQSADGVDGLVAGVSPHLQNDPGLLYERLRWRRRHDLDGRAMEILHNAPPADRIGNPAAWWQERHILARRLIGRKEYQGAYRLVAGHRQTEGLGFAQAEFLAGWLALRFLDEPWQAFEHFEKLYHGTSTPISRARGAYWAGRASAALGYPDVATRWYQESARHQTTFYGQLAIGTLDSPYRPPQQVTPERTVEGELRFESKDMVQVVGLLHEAGGYRGEISSFLDALGRSVRTPEDYLLVADLSQKLDQYHKAVSLARQGLGKNIVLMDHAYPTMLARMRPVRTEWALVHALIRQESAFDYHAQSHAGARGLMQLMPATAQEVARKQGLSYRLEWLTSRPDLNIRLGSAYLDEMLARYDGSYVLALAAYNAGPGRADRWLREIGDPRRGEIDMIDWVELIPIYETRNYVQRVLESVYIYRIKFRGVQRSAASPIHVAYTE